MSGTHQAISVALVCISGAGMSIWGPITSYTERHYLPLRLVTPACRSLHHKPWSTLQHFAAKRTWLIPASPRFPIQPQFDSSTHFPQAAYTKHRGDIVHRVQHRKIQMYVRSWHRQVHQSTTLGRQHCQCGFSFGHLNLIQKLIR
jgi:hypothetical protein